MAKVSIIGLGREGKALARFLARKGDQVTVSDIKGEESLAERVEELSHLPVRFLLGGHPQELLEADIIYVSPGVPQTIPILAEARRRGIPLSSETRLFFSLCRAPIIGVTGSSGKTTTTALVGEILRADGKETWVGGNIGSPLIERVEEIEPEAWVVMELSSFQLETLDMSPPVASILNIAPDHLDRHPSMEAYLSAKLNILRYQGPEDHAVLSRDDPRTYALASQCRGRLSLFSRIDGVEEGAFIRGERIWLRRDNREEEVCRKGDIRLLGEHNLDNVLAACAISSAAGATVKAMAQVCTTFTGVEHRLELVREWKGVSYYNDSIATSPHRAMAALRSFDRPIVLLAGGKGKGLPLEELAALIVQKVRHLILFGPEGPRLEEAVRRAQRERGADLPAIQRAQDLAEAVNLAVRASRPGEVVLLSPACTSFDQYRDFAQRGEHFKALVEALG